MLTRGSVFDRICRLRSRRSLINCVSSWNCCLFPSCENGTRERERERERERWCVRKKLFGTEQEKSFTPSPQNLAHPCVCVCVCVCVYVCTVKANRLVKVCSVSCYIELLYWVCRIGCRIMYVGDSTSTICLLH